MPQPTNEHTPGGLDPTRDPERPGPPATPRDSRTPPPSTLVGDEDPGSAGPPTVPDRSPDGPIRGGDDPL